ncbi:MAG: peptidoglycan synthetase [Bacteroidales bacterium]|nr:Mur ligase family protein [Bacteroidota bacterium]MZP81725.1 peptidoglycan synthetase [Bacteroidales bacterium]
MNIHFIAIGGSAMHNLAIALKQKGYTITGSDDEIFEPSRSRLEREGLLPERVGWFPQKITSSLDAVVLGMHARADNPELLQAQQLGLKIYSYPEYLYEQTKDKTRVVIGGSHGKTTITSMVMHVLKSIGVDFDFMVGAQIDGFDNMVRLSESARFAIFEGDEYLTSPIDPRPKFHLYKPHIAVISGIAWDHINVFPDFDTYRRQFEMFIQTIEPQGHLFFCAEDPEVVRICKNAGSGVNAIPYTTHPHTVNFDCTALITDHGQVSVKVFGIHNMQNIAAAKGVCNQLGISDENFYNSISSFRGAAKRMQRVGRKNTTDVFLDFAHAPSKVLATVKAVKDQYPYRKLVACLELHTFSSLNPDFLNEYKGTLDEADIPIVYYNPATLEHKKLPPIDPGMVKQKFDNPHLIVFTDPALLHDHLLNSFWDNVNLLMMSSGNFSGIDVSELAMSITEDDDFPGCYMDF